MISFGEDLCLSVLDAYPSMAAPAPEGGPKKSFYFNPDVPPAKIRQPREVVYNKRNRDPASNPTTGDFGFGQFTREISHWRQYYQTFSTGYGVSLISNVGLKELESNIMEDGKYAFFLFI